MSAQELTFLQRGFVRLMSTLSERSEGYTVGFAGELVRQHGITGFFKWASATQKAWNQLVARYGERDSHLLACIASAWNGCDYCAYGHLLAFNLHVFEDEQQLLFPIDEADIPALLRQRDRDILQGMMARLQDPRWNTVRTLIERQYQLRSGEAEAQGDEDRMLLIANALYEWVNECSIVVEAPAPPLGRIAKKKPLLAAYQAARTAERQAAAGTATAAAAAQA